MLGNMITKQYKNINVKKKPSKSQTSDSCSYPGY